MMIKDNHLGGFVHGGDSRTWTPILWNRLIYDFKVKSVIDVGCGEGHAAKFFKDRGLRVLAIDGSEKVLDSAVFNPIIIHDYTKGPYIPDKEYDLVWCCEFVEHVEDTYIENFLDTFKKAKVVAMTHALPGQGGYHHVNEQPALYWIKKMKKAGFDFDSKHTEKYWKIAEEGYFKKTGMIFVRH